MKQVGLAHTDPFGISTARLQRLGNRARRRLRSFVRKRHFTMPVELRRAKRLGEAIRVIRQRWPLGEQDLRDPERPVFIFSAGWRSGSTLLQRLVVSSGEVGIWGEPLGETGMIAKLAHSLSIVTEDWPPGTFFPAAEDLGPLADQWIANLTPDMAYLRHSHRSLLKGWLGAPAARRFGVERWGFKEVRLTIHHAEYLKWLYPHARFLFIYRRLHDAFRSWKGNRWLNSWPGYYSRSPVVFARHWRLLLEGFFNACDQVDGMMIRFEDLVGHRLDLDRIARHVGVDHLDPGILDRKIGSPGGRPVKKKSRLTLYDRVAIEAVAGSCLKRAGYTSH